LRLLLKRLSIVPILALALAVAGCGGDEGDSTGAAAESTSASSSESGRPPLSKSEFIARGDAICDATDKRQAAKFKIFVEKNGKSDSPAYEERLVSEVGLPEIRVELKALRRLRLPQGDGIEINEILESAEEAVLTAEEEPGKVLKTGNPFAASEELAKKYGFKACGFL
jgi:hypothetical protein